MSASLSLTLGKKYLTYFIAISLKSGRYTQRQHMNTAFIVTFQQHLRQIIQSLRSFIFPLEFDIYFQEALTYLKCTIIISTVKYTILSFQIHQLTSFGSNSFFLS